MLMDAVKTQRKRLAPDRFRPPFAPGTGSVQFRYSSGCVLFGFFEQKSFFVSSPPPLGVSLPHQVTLSSDRLNLEFVFL